MQDTCFMLGSASLLSFWGNICQERSADVEPNASFAVFPIIDTSIQHRFFTGTCPSYLLNCVWTYLLTCIASAQSSRTYTRPLRRS
jgi:hypothetical protein